METQYLETHKFGGTSLSNAECFANVYARLPNNPCIVVVSAIENITNQLQHAIDTAIKGQLPLAVINTIHNTHLTLINQLALNEPNKLIETIEADVATITTVLTSITVVKHCSDAERAEILGFGERSSARILSAHINQFRSSQYLDASAVLYTETQHGIQSFDLKKTKIALQGFLSNQQSEILVITGFLARDINEHKTLLGRNGSDVSASIFAELFSCQSLTIWTDKDGVFTCDPNIVEMAFPISAMSYNEALELAYFGAKIIHPQTIAPAKNSNRTIFIKNSLKPQAPGTTISQSSPYNAHHVRGITSIKEIDLLMIEGSGMIGIAGISSRAFTALYNASISVILISQASSEQSICLCVNSNKGELAQKVLQECFAYELEHQAINKILLEDKHAIVAAVGDQMTHQIGIAGKMCSTLGNARVNIRAIAQGASERNISVVIKQADIVKALKSLHSSFYLSAKTIAIGVIGAGVIGTEFINQLARTVKPLFEKHNIAFHLRGIINSSKMLLAEQSISLDFWQEQFTNATRKANIDEWLQHLDSDAYAHTVIIDCTASAGIAERYSDFIRHGMHIITPNKQANSGSIKQYHELRNLARKNKRQFLYETTVCAGLPIMTTLQDIINTGDTVLEIQGVVSGSLNYIFHQINQHIPFSTAVKQAKELGYSEPDPREDLSGRDVARKMITLARELQIDIQLEQLDYLDLVPEPLRDVSTTDFLSQLIEFDPLFQQQLEKKKGSHPSIAYVGKIDTQSRSVKIDLEPIDAQHPFSGLSGTDNMIIFKTERYNQQPLIVRGPGAGAEVTASGIFADLLRLTSSLTQ